MIFVRFIFYFIFLLPFHPALLQKLCLGNATHPPDFSQHHMLYIHFMHTHTCKEPKKCIPTRPPHTHPQPSIMYIFRNPTTHSSKSHTPTNPSQFLQIPTGLTEPSKAARIHPQPHILSVRGHTQSTIYTQPLTDLQHMKRTKNVKTIWHQKPRHWAHVTWSSPSSSKPWNPNTSHQCSFNTGLSLKCTYKNSATEDRVGWKFKDLPTNHIV